MAGVATSALEHIATADVDGRDRSLIVGEIDPDPFYDFTVERPTVEIVGREDGETGTGDQLAGEHPARRPHGRRSRHRGVERCRAAPPVDDVRAVHHGGDRGARRDAGRHARVDRRRHAAHPHAGGRRQQLPTGASPASSALAPPTYQGVTGLVGVLHSELERVGIPSVSLRVGVPHYLAMGEHPRAVTSLVLHTSHVIGIPLPIDLRESIERWDEAHSASIADDDKIRRYVEVLEAEYDRRAEAAVTSADDLAASFEAYLRDDSAAKGDHPASGPHTDDEQTDDEDQDDEEHDGA